MKKYYLVTLEVAHDNCTGFKKTFVISESPIQLLMRQDKRHSTSFSLILEREIPCSDYLQAKPVLNFTNDGSYINLKKSDYSKWIKGED